MYDILGREVHTLADEELSPGNYTVNFDAAGLSSGVYFYRLTAGNFTQTKKMILLR
ncbi:MAG: T9SS type A sorting domain-containing protein [Bacteroidota bacterium]